MTIQVSDLCVSYGSFRVLKDVNCSLENSEILCVIGPNGSGKSTLVKALAGILTPDSGTIIINGSDADTISGYERGRTIGYVPQDFSYLTSATVLELVLLGRRPHVSWSLSETDLAIVYSALEQLGILGMAQKNITALSGGERQKVFIARALAQEPELFLFDEPTSALDIRHQIDVFEMMRDLVRHKGRSVLVVVHDLNFAYHYSDRVILMDEGSIVATGPPDQVMTHDLIESVYHVPMQYVDTSQGRYIMPLWT
ncbi:MAG: ABC transporter ATP-binding protein [Methanospirillaceae archaeon]|nr:ABC transporter ATP-binding protein [Methanospirillaceae archaeon]